MVDLIERIQRVLEEEKVRPLKVRDPSETPGTYEAVTDEWLTKIVCRDTPGARVETFSLGEPDDGSSNRRRIFLDYNETGKSAGLPPSVFCKAATTFETRMVLTGCGAAMAEVDFYNKVRPRLDILATEAYYASYDPRTCAYFVMLKDIGETVDFPDERHATTLQEAESLVDTLARLHSRFYESPELGSESLPFARWEDWWSNTVTALQGFEESCDQAFVDSESIMAPRLFRRRAEIWPKTMASAVVHARLPRTLIHCDTHLKNWFIASDGRLGLHDWQNITVGHWSRDLIYALTTSLTVEDRRAWLHGLFQLYLEKMEQHGAPRIPMADLLLNVRQQLMTALAFWTITLRPAPGMAAMQPERTTLTFLERFLAAIDDLEALDAFE